jgi:hypothetical protein
MLLKALVLAAVVAAQPLSVVSEHASPSAINAGKGWREVSIRTTALPLNAPDNPAPGVAFAGALDLVSDSIDRLHGLSDLKFTSDKDFLAVSDEGWLVSGRVVLDAMGRLAGVERVRTQPLLGETGDRLFDRPRRQQDNYDTWADSEGLATLPGGRYLVSFEHHQRVWMYGVDKRGDDLPRAMISPPFAIDYNAGPEALAYDGRGGYYVALEAGGAYHCRKDRCLPIDPDPEPPLNAATDLRVVSLDLDPLGRGLFVLERAFRRETSENVIRISLWRDPDHTPFARKELVLELKNPMTVDNMEGLGVVRHGKGVRFYLVSDDNFSRFQKTLLMAFDYAP